MLFIEWNGSRLIFACYVLHRSIGGLRPKHLQGSRQTEELLRDSELSIEILFFVTVSTMKQQNRDLIQCKMPYLRTVNSNFLTCPEWDSNSPIEEIANSQS